ncbi:peroxisomal nicotinamide adenine dinucleotide carrier-like isoform X2 [Typha latifolia]|uniref:peroxisomal nicotinamide adenine dinucleotide carrier-like isoform X2 n=1 Tax=Typha latifolia TaxID=4733 RepID=UPI003C2E76A0
MPPPWTNPSQDEALGLPCRWAFLFPYLIGVANCTQRRAGDCGPTTGEGTHVGCSDQRFGRRRRRVSTRQQIERDPSNSTSRDGIIRQMYQVVKQEGWERLYGGLTPSLVGMAASQGVYYYFYQVFRNRAESAALKRWKKGVGDGSISIFQSITVAALSGCINVLLTNPIWVVVTRMQTYKKTNKMQPTHGLPCAFDETSRNAVVENISYRTSHVVQEVYDDAGLWGFWNGVTPTLIMVSNPTIQFMLYETILKNLRRKRASNLKGADGLTTLEIFLLGAIAKLGATLVTYPLLVVKSRLQVKQGLDDDKRYHYKGIFDAIEKMIYYEGLSGLYKGMSTKIVQSVFAAAILFMVKEELVKAAHLLVTGDISLIQNLRLKSSR